MSKVGKKLIAIPKGVEVKINDSLIAVKGPKGELSRALPEGMNVSVENEQVTVRPSKEGREASAGWGLWRALINNMILGVSEGYEKVLEFQGVGYKAAVKGKDLELNLGFSHPITYPAPEGINFAVEKNAIRISGLDKQMVGQVAAEIRSIRKPEPYKGSGIRYRGEIVRKKAGKKAVASG